jgi:uncharacterized protein (TIGR02569 family)
MESGPDVAVLEEFNCNGQLSRMPGGQGVAWRTGEIVLKPLDMPIGALAWLDERLAPLAQASSVRLSLPIRSRSGCLVVDGWTAFPFLPGSHQPGRWLEVIAAGEAFSRLVEHLPRPEFIQARGDEWARADRAAWGEEDIAGLADIPHISRLLGALRPVAARSQLVHGDLTGNVLFHERASPAVIDLSLYWRPASYGSAIVAADAISFENAPDTLLRDADTTPEFVQCFARALIFRIATDCLRGNEAALGTAADPYRRAIGLLFDRM